MAASVVNSDAPFSKGRANSHHTHSLGTPKEGHGNLDQYRAQIADDVAHAAVLAETDKFCDAYFPKPSHPSPNKPKPVLDDNPFAKTAQLKKFEGNEAEIFDEFVSGHGRLYVLISQPSIATWCRSRPSTPTILFQGSSSAYVDGGQTASTSTRPGRRSTLRGISNATP